LFSAASNGLWSDSWCFGSANELIVFCEKKGDNANEFRIQQQQPGPHFAFQASKGCQIQTLKCNSDIGWHKAATE
jgi:hypothetical protein